MKVKVTELTHEEIVNIIETACYGNSAISIERPLGFECLVQKSSVYGSAKQADVLLGGGYVYVWDLYAEADSLKDALSDKAAEYDESDCSIAYKMTLDDLLEACSNNIQEAIDVIGGSGDYFDAWNIIQCAIFGEVIYG